MANGINSGEIFPLNSITNPESTNILDANEPFDFFTFLKNLKTTLPSAEYNNLYLKYIEIWSTKKGNIKSETDSIIKNSYIGLLKDITLNYFTIEEKRFVSQLDFNDEFDLDIIIPFYSRKLIEICDFYAKKREDIKFATVKNTFKGTFNSLDRCIYESVTDFLLIQDESILDTINKNFDIEIEELFDLYQNYLDIDPSFEYDGTTEKRKRLYSSNVNSIDVDIFLDFDTATKKQLFENLRTFLIEFKNNFTVNYNINDIDLNCKTGDKLYNFVTDRKDKATRSLILKNSLIKKYIGVDYHYITTGDTITDVVSGVLFEAENPSGNLLNRHFPSTATVEEESELYTLRKIGILFKPEKNSILHFSVPNKKFILDESKLEPNKVYIFPDPAIYTNAEGKTKYDIQSPLIYVESYEDSMRDASYGITFGDVESTIDSQDFHGYKSKRTIDSISKYGEKSVDIDFCSIYDAGVLHKFTEDVYGNKYGLFKKTYKPLCTDNRTSPISSNQEIDVFFGGPIKFKNGNLPELVPPTSSNWVYPDIWSSQYYYNLAIDAGIGRIYEEPIPVGGTYKGRIPQRGTDNFVSQFTISGVDTHSDSYTLSSIQYRVMDGGSFADSEIYTVQNEYLNNKVILIGKTINPTVSSVIEDEDTTKTGGGFLSKTTGVIYVKKPDGVIELLTNALSSVFETYDNDIINEIENYVLDFNIYGDVIWIKTKNYLIFEKLKFVNNKFVFVGTLKNKIYCNQSLSSFAISDPFIFENKPYIAIGGLEIVDDGSYGFSLIPKIYFSYNKNCIIKQMFPKETDSLDIFKNIEIPKRPNEFYLHIKPKKINSVSLTYNSKQNKYGFVAVIEDQNGMPYIYKTVLTFDGRDFKCEIPYLSYMETPTYIRTLSFVGNYIKFGAFMNADELLGTKIFEKNDFIDLNNITNTISGQLISQGEVKLYVQ